MGGWMAVLGIPLQAVLRSKGLPRAWQAKAAAAPPGSPQSCAHPLQRGGQEPVCVGSMPRVLR